jgi:hypothetical protein
MNLYRLLLGAVLLLPVALIFYFEFFLWGDNETLRFENNELRVRSSIPNDDWTIEAWTSSFSQMDNVELKTGDRINNLWNVEA